MSYEKNQQIELTVTDLGTEGEGIGKTDAFTWFIKDTVPGDHITAAVMKTKKTYGYARLLKILSPSKDRVIPACPVARQCGGCSLQTLSYESQLAFKEKKVRNNLIRIGGFAFAETGLRGGRECAFASDHAGIPGAATSGSQEKLPLFHPIIGMEHPFRYRNKAQYPIGRGKDGKPVAGFYAGHTHSIIPCKDCLIGAEENAAVLRTVLSWMEEFGVSPYEEESGKGLIRHVLIRKGFSSGEMMTCLVVNGKKAPREEILSERLMQLPGMRTVVLNINTEKGNVILGRDCRILRGPGYITDTIGNVIFEISAQSFYQVNPVQTEKLYGTALRFAGLAGNETVWDLYCGIGTISLFLARKAKKVTGVEIIPQAIEDAKRNAERNGITNAEFLVGEAETVLTEKYEREHAAADVIVVDPPRKGCDEKCLQTILKMNPARIVYVSCDSATLARDLKLLCADGTYALREVQPVDMFPQGVHVETVVLMSRVENQP